MPLGAASALTFFYALGYPVGALAVSVMSPMAVLVFRFGLAAAILATWAALARVTWPTGRTLVHVLISGLLAQGLLFSCLYVALLHGAPAVLGAVIISMNPVVTTVLAAMFLGEGLTWTRIGALALGVVAVLAACAGRLIAVGGVDPVVLLILVSLFSVAAGGVYQQKFCSGVDFRATAALQNAACILPGRRARVRHAVDGDGCVEGGGRRRRGGAAERGAVHDVVRARNQRLRRGGGGDVVHGHSGGRRPVVLGDARPASGYRHRRGPGRRRGGLLAQREGFTSAASAFGDLADGLHHAGELSGDIRTGGLIHKLGHPARFVFANPIAQLRGRPAERELRQ